MLDGCPSRRGSAGKTPPGYHSHGEPSTSPNLPKFTPPALANAAQPASHRHVISYQQTGQHLPLLEGGSRASSAPPCPEVLLPTAHARLPRRAPSPLPGGAR